VSGTVEDQADPSSPAEAGLAVTRPFREVRFGRQVKLPVRVSQQSLPEGPGSDVDPRIFIPPRDTDTTFVIGRIAPMRCTDTGIFVTHARGELKRQVPRSCLDRPAPRVMPLSKK